MPDLWNGSLSRQMHTMSLWYNELCFNYKDILESNVRGGNHIACFWNNYEIQFMTIFLKHQENYKLKLKLKNSIQCILSGKQLTIWGLEPKMLSSCVFTYSSAKPNLETGKKHVSSCAGVEISQAKWNWRSFSYYRSPKNIRTNHKVSKHCLYNSSTLFLVWRMK